MDVYVDAGELREEMDLYNLAGTTAFLARRDIIQFVLKILDHSLKSVALEWGVDGFGATFVGAHRLKRPFQGLDGDNVRCIPLLKFMDYLQGEGEQDWWEESDEKLMEEFVEVTPIAFDVGEREQLLAACKRLLDAAENHFVGLLQRLGVNVMDPISLKNRIHSELVNFSDVYWFDYRPIAHPFTILVLTAAKSKTLLEQKCNRFDFPMANPIFFSHDSLGWRMLVLDNLERQGLEVCYQNVLLAGFFLIKSFIARNNHVKRQVRFRSLSAVIPGVQEPNEPPLVLDLDLARVAAAPNE